MNPSNACRVLASVTLPAATIAANRTRVRGMLFDRFPDLALSLGRPTDVVEAYVGAGVGRGDDTQSRALEYKGDSKGSGDTEELTLAAVTAAAQLIDAVVFAGTLGTSFAQKGWSLDMSVTDAPRDTIHVVKAADGREVLTRGPLKAQGIHVALSARVPDSYCFKHADAPPQVFGIECRDPLDVVIVQLEHQLIHAALLVGGCADADPTIVLALEQAAIAPDAASLWMALDSLPHSELMATAVRGLFGHVTPLHGAHVWSVPPGSASGMGTPPCCMRPLPIDSRPVFTPKHTIESFWQARSALRSALKRQGSLPAIAFDPALAAWTTGWRLVRAGRWFVELVADAGCGGGKEGMVLHVPIPFARPFLDAASIPRLPSGKVFGGYWGMLASGANVIVLPTAEEDLARNSGDDEVATLSTLSRERRAKFLEAMGEGLGFASFAGVVGKWGDKVELGDGTVVAATRILPLEMWTEDPRAP